jgi:defect in organelle trafficking protein DotD
MRITTILLSLSLLSLTPLLSGCRSSSTLPQQGNYPSVQPLENQLGSAAQSVSASLRTLAKAQKSNGALSVLDTAPLITPEGGMGGLVMLDWSGPIEPLLQKISELTNYHVKVLGSPPTPPILVSISGDEQMVADILKDASLQANKEANIVVYPGIKIIELRYLTNS